MIRTDAIWLATEPLDMRAGIDSLLARVIQVFGAAQSHHAYLFANARANRIKVLAHDGQGIWLSCRRLNEGRFKWPREGTTLTLTREQFDALVVGLPWQPLANGGVIRMV
jgi:transposase